MGCFILFDWNSIYHQQHNFKFSTIFLHVFLQRNETQRGITLDSFTPQREMWTCAQIYTNIVENSSGSGLFVILFSPAARFYSVKIERDSIWNAMQTEANHERKKRTIQQKSHYYFQIYFFVLRSAFLWSSACHKQQADIV